MITQAIQVGTSSITAVRWSFTGTSFENALEALERFRSLHEMLLRMEDLGITRGITSFFLSSSYDPRTLCLAKAFDILHRGYPLEDQELAGEKILEHFGLIERPEGCSKYSISSKGVAAIDCLSGFTPRQVAVQDTTAESAISYRIDAVRTGVKLGELLRLNKFEKFIDPSAIDPDRRHLHSPATGQEWATLSQALSLRLVKWRVWHGPDMCLGPKQVEYVGLTHLGRIVLNQLDHLEGLRTMSAPRS